MIYTVTGPIEKEKMGITLSHEHFKWEYDEDYAFGLYYNKVYNNTHIKESVDVILPILNELYKLSCRTVVEASPPIGGQNLKLLKELSEKSNMNIIPSTGWNMSKHTYEVLGENYGVQLSKRWISDFENGLDTLDGITIKPGYIKLLLDTGKLSAVDKEMLKAAVITSKKTNLAIHCHILEPEMVYKVVEFLETEQLDFSKFLWAHANYEGDLETIKYALKKGMWVGFDIIRINDHDKNVNLIKEMIKLDCTNRVILSQDYEFYAESKKNNAPVCYSFFTDFIPLCKREGITEDTLIKMLTVNPATYYDV